MDALLERFTELLARLDAIEATQRRILSHGTQRAWYTVEEIAEILGRSNFTVREWCRMKRIHAEKKASGRGSFKAWAVSHSELERIQRNGLLPVGGEGHE